MVTPSTRHYALLVLIAAVWGSSFQAMKISVAEIPPLSIAAGRVILGAAVVWPYMHVVRQQTTRGAVGGGVRLWVAAMSIATFNTALPFFLLPWGEQFVGSGAAAILMGVGPIFALLLAHVFTVNDRLTAGKLIGMTLGLAGIAVMVGPQAVLEPAGPVRGYGAILLAALSHSIGGILTVRIAGRQSSEVLTGAVLACGAAVLLPLAAIVDRPWTLRPGPVAIGAVLYLAVFPTAVALLIRFRLIAEVGYTFVAQSVYMIPLFGAVWGWVLLGERLTLTTWLALALILLGVGVARARISNRMESL